MRIVRLVLGGLGLGAAAYGLVELLDVGLDNLRAVLVWLVGGVVVHDGVLAPATVGLGVLVVAVRRRPVPAPLVAGAVVLGTVTVVAVPVLGRFGARPDNPTLLDRDYGLGWLVLATLTLLVSAAATAVTVARSRKRGGDDGSGAGRR